MMGTSGIDQALEAVESLPQEEQRLLVDLVEHRIAERRRAEIAENAKLTRQAVRAGRASVGSLEDLRRDLETSD
jgi:hypothetical protein